MLDTSKAYLEFIRYSISTDSKVPESASSIDWRDYLHFCNRQSVIGLVFGGIQKADLNIDQSTLMQWIMVAESLKEKNRRINKNTILTDKLFAKLGLRTCIMKGQANGLMYPNPELRTPGDIDVWAEGKPEVVIKKVLGIAPRARYTFQHIKLRIFKKATIEVHYRPMYLTNWFKDRKVQQYISEIEDRQFSNRVPFYGDEIGCLTDDFNVIFQLLHMHSHFFTTRNNFKQFIDYYYLLKKIGGNIDKERACELLDRFGVRKYASGIMWIMRETLGLDAECLIMEPHAEMGKLILLESQNLVTTKDKRGRLRYLIRLIFGNLRIARYLPSDVLISPLFLIWHQWWKQKMKRAVESTR